METSGIIDLLRTLPIFAGLSEEEVTQILAVGYKQVAGAGDVLMKSGDEADCFYLILKGRVEIRVRQRGEKIPIAFLESGQLVGEMALFLPASKRLADAIVTKSAILLQFQYGRLKLFLERAPDLASRFIKNLRLITAERAQQYLSTSELAEAKEHTPIKTAAALVEWEQVALAPIQIKMALARCALFEGFDDSELGGIISVGTPVRFQDNESIIHEGEIADCLYVLALGRLEVAISVGGALKLIATIGPGQCVGEMPLAFGIPKRSCSVIARTPASLVRIGYVTLSGVIDASPGTRAKFKANIQKLATERA